MNFTVSVIFTTYNSPEWLEKVLWGFENQIFKDFDIVVADDGSTSETRELLERFKAKSDLDIHHVWHEDDGFRKCGILNKAILRAKGDYLIFTDGDCIPRNDFVKVHIESAEPGRFLSGGYFKLPMSTSLSIEHNDIVSGSVFDVHWLKNNGFHRLKKSWKLTRNDLLSKFLNIIVLTKKTWNGNNSSGWKSDIVEVNGFDERMGYGGEDVEMGMRLINLGVKAKRIRYSTVCVHLDHARGYINDAAIKLNKAIIEDTEKRNKLFTEYGIYKK